MSSGEPDSYERLTPAGIGGIHVFAIAGPGVVGFLERHFVKKSRSAGDLSFGHLIEADDVIDEVIVHHLPERIDLSIHGGIAIERRVASLLEAAGFRNRLVHDDRQQRRLAPAIHDEAETALIAATAPHAVLFFLSVLEGGLSREISGWISTLLPGESVHEARRVGVEAAIDSLLKRAEFGLAMTTPPSIVLSGPVNAGKSTLFNAMLGKDRAIVTQEAGTTRDLIEAPLEVEGYPFRFIDTAGIRETTDVIEEEGVGRAKKARDEAMLAIAVIPAVSLLAAPDDEFHHSLDAADIVVASKTDELTGPQERSQLADLHPHAHPISVHDDEGLDELRRLIVFRSPFAGPAVRDFPCPFTRRQVELLERAHAIIPHDPPAAAEFLQLILRG